MTPRKAKLGQRIERDILRVLDAADRPVSTRDLALKVGRAWHAVQHHCMKLQLEGRVNGYRISNLNVWSRREGKR